MSTKDSVETLIDLDAAERSARGQTRHHIRKARKRVEHETGPAVRKTVAANILGISRTTLDKWILRGRIPVVDRSGRRMVPIKQLIPLAREVRELREAGTQDGIVAAALLRVEQSDPAWRGEFDELYGPGLEAIEAGDLIPATIPEDFGPED